MADKSIGDLNFAPGTVDDSNTLFVVQQSGAAYKLSGHEFILAMTSVLDGHGGIKSITYTPPVAPSLTGTMVVTLADNTTTSVNVQNGKGIVSIAKTGTSGLVDTYTITYNDNTTSTFTVTNGAKGDKGDAWYVWIRYSGSMPAQDSDMGTTPDNWMGIYSGTSSTAPVHYTSYQWFQIKGEKGDTGDAANIESTAVEYQTSSSGTVVPSGTWSPSVPTVTQGDFLWTRTTISFNTGDPVVWYAVAYQAIDGQGAPSSATPLMDAGTGSAGIGTSFSRDDHIHPTDTSRAAQSDMTAAQSNITALQNTVAATQQKYTVITLPATWTLESTDVYYQTITISGATNKTKVDLSPNASTIQILANDGVMALYILNDNGTLKAYAVGASPSVQLLIDAYYYEIA